MLNVTTTIFQYLYVEDKVIKGSSAVIHDTEVTVNKKDVN